VVAAREWATGSIPNSNPLPDHYFNNDIFIQVVHKLQYNNNALGHFISCKDSLCSSIVS
jgi:hypothetical protein